MIPGNVQEVFRSVVEALEEAALDYGVMGGYAVVTWGVPRATFDIDILVPLGGEGLEPFFAACERRGFEVPDEYRRGWQDRIRDMPLLKVKLFCGGRPVSVDVFLVATPFLASAFSRRALTNLAGIGVQVPVISAADLILFKLMAHRLKDQADVQNILMVQGIPDEPYLRSWARQLGVEERLKEAIAQAGLSLP